MVPFSPAVQLSKLRCTKKKPFSKRAQREVYQRKALLSLPCRHLPFLWFRTPGLKSPLGLFSHLAWEGGRDAMGLRMQVQESLLHGAVPTPLAFVNCSQPEGSVRCLISTPFMFLLPRVGWQGHFLLNAVHTLQVLVSSTSS